MIWQPLTLPVRIPLSVKRWLVPESYALGFFWARFVTAGLRAAGCSS